MSRNYYIREDLIYGPCAPLVSVSPGKVVHACMHFWLDRGIIKGKATIRKPRSNQRMISTLLPAVLIGRHPGV